MTLSAYEQKEWDRLQQRKADALSKKARHLLPTAARDRISTAVDTVKQAPAAELAGTAYANATTELGKIIGSAASITVSSESVVRQFRAAGYEIGALGSIQGLDLEAVDSVARLSRIRWGHSGLAALSGFASAAAITGGGVLVAKGTVHDEGAKKAPGFGSSQRHTPQTSRRSSDSRREQSPRPPATTATTPIDLKSRSS